METERAKMGLYMKELQRLLGYQTLKAKFIRNFHIEEPVHDEDDTEITFITKYKSPIVEMRKS